MWNWACSFATRLSVLVTLYGLVMVNEGLVEWLGLGEVCMRSNRRTLGSRYEQEGFSFEQGLALPPRRPGRLETIAGVG